MVIGIITIYSVPNYGSVLQAFATQTFLESCGFKCVFIDYSRDNDWYFRHGNTRPNYIKRLIRKLGLKDIHRKEIKIEQFRKQYLKKTKTFYSLEELNSADWSSFNLFAVGSDQVWNTRLSYGDKAYLLSFIDDDKKKISLASSFALKELPQAYEDTFKKNLSTFKALSVREANGKEIIQKQLNIDKPVEVILDPTLWLSREQWLNSIPHSKFKKTEKYILFYMWDYAFKPQPYIYKVAKKLQDKYGYIIYVLEGRPNELDEFGLKYKSVIDSSIQEFIDYFHYADIVITSSFHGTAFAVNFGIPLISVVPSNGDDRQSSLLTSVGLYRLAKNIDSPLSEIHPFYDTDLEQKNLSTIRMKSTAWIRNALK